LFVQKIAVGRSFPVNNCMVRECPLSTSL
jgi:hypothetical protein